MVGRRLRGRLSDRERVLILLLLMLLLVLLMGSPMALSTVVSVTVVCEQRALLWRWL
jgi:hypothetical protein